MANIKVYASERQRKHRAVRSPDFTPRPLARPGYGVTGRKLALWTAQAAGLGLLLALTGCGVEPPTGELGINFCGWKDFFVTAGVTIFVLIGIGSAIVFGLGQAAAFLQWLNQTTSRIPEGLIKGFLFIIVVPAVLIWAAGLVGVALSC